MTRVQQKSQSQSKTNNHTYPNLETGHGRSNSTSDLLVNTCRKHTAHVHRKIVFRKDVLPGTCMKLAVSDWICREYSVAEVFGPIKWLEPAAKIHLNPRSSRASRNERVAVLEGEFRRLYRQLHPLAFVTRSLLLSVTSRRRDVDERTRRQRSSDALHQDRTEYAAPSHLARKCLREL